ncbi:M14 family zinc carboxypeptidase [Euzebya tangerina]|uniref:M14 family zinc carboxypeptidase n=1 Tax=Euzebya tangerina TaxID=591198 RepID=UPI000E31AF11|nr:M14 family zinc carboxypeptidase [Euzebya tangerina]
MSTDAVTSARRLTRTHWPLALALLIVAILGTAAQGADPEASEPGPDQLGAYDVVVSPQRAETLRVFGYDITRVAQADQDEVRLEVIMTGAQAEELQAAGDVVEERPAGDGQGTTFNQAGVFRPWSGPGNLAEEVDDLVAAYPDITERITIGQSLNGQDIVAVRVTGDPDGTEIGDLPAVLYQATQHAREWIAPEVNRRLLRYVLENYDSGTDTEITELVDTRDLYFIVVANPDGYDWTFTPGNRLWRKNLQDNNGDGSITADADGVDLNRNWPYQWGYDNEGSSPDPADATYRGTAPGSEPEIQALDAFIGEISPAFLVDYHSAAELILYGAGSQVATPTPDDVILEALAGDDAKPAVEGYDPDLSAELYITNGAATENAQNVHGALAYTPELSTCQTVAPDPQNCQSVFNFPDDEALIQAEFEKNIEFALDLARSADDPYEPDSHIGNTADDFQIDPFEEAHSGTTEVAAIISRQIEAPEVNWSVGGGATQTAATTEWDGGERYGADFDRYYREVRGTVTGAAPGDSVEVWFSGNGAESERFTYTVSTEPSNVLVVANEDYDGFNPEQPDVDAPQYAQIYVDALEAASYSAEVWDLDSQGVPHHLGVLAHYDAVIWYSGQNRLTQAADDTGFGGDALVDESMVELTVSLRDYLNEGGKVMNTGEFAGYFGLAGQVGFGGALVADNGDITSTCTDPNTCLLYSDDFHQYYLGAWNRVNERPATAVIGTAGALADSLLELADEPSPQDAAGEFVVTSDILPADEFPLFASETIARYGDLPGVQGPFAPLDSDFYVGVPATNLAYNRVTRTIDLTGVTAGEAPTLTFATSYDVEAAYDFFAVEARTDGGNDWTTLPDANGSTVQGPLSVCTDGLWDVHPFIFDHYVDGACNPTGPTGEFHAFNGNSGGYVDASFDLSAYAGSVVEVSLAYISDVGLTNTGVVVDDVEIVVDGDVIESEGFEDGLGEWAATPPPAGSPDPTINWERTESILPTLSAGIATEDTIFLPWGLEAIGSTQARNAAFLRLVDDLVGLDRPSAVASVTASIDGDAVLAEFEVGANFDQSAGYRATAYADGEPVAQVEVEGSPARLEGIEPGTYVEVGVAPFVNDVVGEQVLSEEIFFSPEQPDGITRIGGGDRIAGAIEVCQYLVPDYTQARRVVLARDDAFADALAGSPLAGPDACILFTEGGPDAELNADVAAEIDRVLEAGDDVFVLGGTEAVSTAVSDALAAAGYDVERFAGETRFETAGLIAQYVHALNPGAEALVAYGYNWPDALVGGAYAARTGVPIVLSETASLHPAAATFMVNAEIEAATLLGGTAVLADDVLDAVPGGVRVAGSNRMGTAAAIAQELWPAFTNGEGAVFINAEADDAWVFALAAAPLSAAAGEPQLGVRADEIPTETVPLLEVLRRGQIIGDSSHIDEAVEGALQAAIEG